MQYSLRTLTMWVAVGPPLLSAAIWIFSPRVSGIGGNIDSARCQIGLLMDAASYYQLEIGSPPPNLQALISLPADTAEPGKWSGPYLDKTTVPLDPWGNEFEYKVFKRGPENEFCVWSRGPDGITPSKDDIYPDSRRRLISR